MAMAAHQGNGITPTADKTSDNSEPKVDAEMTDDIKEEKPNSQIHANVPVDN